jgi:hypothetical protein
LRPQRALACRAQEAAGWLLIAIGSVHNFVAAPMTYDTLSTTALWFVTGGLSLWYAGAINVVHARTAHPAATLSWVAWLTNVTMLAFVVAFAVVNGSWRTAPGVLLVLTVAVALATSLRRRAGE